MESFGYKRLKDLFFLYALITFFSLNYTVMSNQLNFTGNVTVIGLFEIFEPKKGECGAKIVPSSVMAAEAVKWFFQRLHNKNAIPLKIGVKGYRTCRLDSLAAQVAIDVTSQSTSMRTNEQDSPIIGIIGPEFSSEVEAVAPIFASVENDSKLLTVGYSTTAENLNSNRFPNFFRVVPKDSIQIEMMIQSMVKMEWNRIAIVYENDIYGQHAMASLKENAKMNDICVSFTASIDTEDGKNIKEIEEISRNLSIGTKEINRIEGYVFFGTASTANLLLQKIENRDIVDLPIGLFSDGVNMDLNAFRDADGTFDKTSGSLITSPTYREINEFKEHWKNIFTDRKKYEEEIQTNPWLADVYRSLKSCDQTACQFIPLTHEEFEANFPDQPVYIQYAIMASHAIAKAFSILYQDICPDNSSSCDFLSRWSQGHMITTMKDISLNFEADFSSARISSLRGINMSFQDTGDVKVGHDTALYQLFSLQKVNKNDDRFVKFWTVGEFINGEMLFNQPNVSDDDPDDSSAVVWPDVRKGQCGTDQVCKECIPSDLPFHFIHDPGDLYLVGLVPVYEKSGTQDCGKIRTLNGYQLVEGIRLAVEKFNDPNGQYTNYFQGIKIGLIVLNTCNNPTVIQRKILNLHKDGLRLSNGTLIKPADKILGYAGPLSSTVSITVSRVLTNLQKVSISYAATSPALSNKETYAYFMRVVPSDNEQTNAMAHILEELEANYVQVLYSGGAYGEGGLSSLKSALTSRGICIIQEIKVPEGDNYSKYLAFLRGHPHAKIVIIFLRSHVVVPLMETLTGQMEKGEFVFIGSETWNKNQDVLVKDNKQALLGSFTIVLEFARDKELLSKVQKIHPQSYAENPWAEHYLQAKWECHYNTSYDKTYQSLCEDRYASRTTLDPWATAAYFSGLAMLMGASSYLRTVCSAGSTVLCSDYLNNPIGLVNAAQNTVELDIYGNGNLHKLFNENGDGNIGYSIYNIQRDVNDPQSLLYRKIGQYPLIGEFTFDKSLITYPTSDKVVSRCPNEQACNGCFSEAQPLPQEDDEGGLSPWIFVLLVLFLISLGAAITLGILLYRMKRQRKDQEIYLTPAIPAEDRLGAHFEDLHTLERPAAVGESDEVCMEPPHQTTRETDVSTIKIHQTNNML